MGKEMTLADHAEAWWTEKGNTVPERGTAKWEKMYQEWVDFAFGSDFYRVTDDE